MKKKILICESEEVLLTAIEFRLRKQGFEVSLCKKTSSLDDALRESHPDLAIIDLDMGEQSGLALVQNVKDTVGPGVSVLLLADPDAEEQIMQGFGMGIDDFISKPFKPAELLLRTRKILQV